MSTPPARPDPGKRPDPENMRASDADRERAADALREAAGDGRLSMEELDERLDAVYAAKTYAELEPIVADLPHDRVPSAPAPATAGSAQVRKYGGTPTSTTAVGIMGGFSRKGNWTVPPVFTAVAVMGGGEIDLREARFAEPQVRIHAIAVMGGVQITVPEDAVVHVSGMGVMGGFDHLPSASGSDAPDAPEIVIDGVAFWGGVTIERKPLRKKSLKSKEDP